MRWWRCSWVDPTKWASLVRMPGIREEMKHREEHPEEVRVFITAGEASGDWLAAGLMQQLRDQAHPIPIRFEGVGGERMAQQGLNSLFPMTDLSVMGILEVLPKIRTFLKRIRETACHVVGHEFDAFISVDSPDFSFRVAEIVREISPRPPVMLHYVAPSVWAWRPERAAGIARLYDAVLCLLPFEPRYFEAEGMKAYFVGHPVLEGELARADGTALRRKLGIPEDARVIGVLFGSRSGELKRVGPSLRDAVNEVSLRHPDTHVLTLTLPHLEEPVRALLEPVGCQTHVVADQSLKWNVLAAMDGAVATSGTVGLELAVAGVPHVIAYKMNPFTWALIKRRLSTPYAHLANILLERRVVEEHIQKYCRANPIARSLERILSDEWARDVQKAFFKRVTRLLHNPEADGPAAAQAAAAVLSLLGERGAIRVEPGVIRA